MGAHGGGEKLDSRTTGALSMTPVVVKWRSVASRRTAGAARSGNPTISSGDGRAS
jgi:hypothetical protein